MTPKSAALPTAIGWVCKAGWVIPYCAPTTERVKPGVVYTTFHHPLSGANVITTDNSDWATNCPEYKVTAVQATRVTNRRPGRRGSEQFDRRQRELLQDAPPVDTASGGQLTWPASRSINW